MLAFRTPVSKSHLVNDNLSARILVLRMFFLLDDAEHQCYKSHTSDKHQKRHQQLAVAAQQGSGIQAGADRTDGRNTFKGNRKQG